MDAHEELYQIRQELQKIIDELDTVSRGVRSDFSGIGNATCASCITSCADHYRTLKKQLDAIVIEEPKQTVATPAAPTTSQKTTGSSSSSKSTSSSSKSTSSSSKSTSSSSKSSSSTSKSSTGKNVVKGIVDFLGDLFG